jgi:hypothetical protein
MTFSFEVQDDSQPRRFAPRAIAGILAAGLVVLALVALAQDGESAGVAPVTTEMWHAGQHVPRGSFDHHTEDYKSLRCKGVVLFEDPSLWLIRDRHSGQNSGNSRVLGPGDYDKKRMEEFGQRNDGLSRIAVGPGCSVCLVPL